MAHAPKSKLLSAWSKDVTLELVRSQVEWLRSQMPKVFCGMQHEGSSKVDRWLLQGAKGHYGVDTHRGQRCVCCVQAGAYFSEELNGQLVDALLEYGEKQLVGTERAVHLMYTCLRMLQSCTNHAEVGYVAMKAVT
jgi:hypothetical protein